MNWDYVAGLFDGEGCVSIYKKENTAKVDITNTHKSTIDMVRDFLLSQNIKVSTYGTKPSARGKDGFRRKTCYHLCTTGNISAMKFLLAVQDRVYIKLEKTKHVLKFLEENKNKDKWFERYPKETIETVIKSVEEGKTIEEAADIAGMHPRTVSYWLKKMGKTRELEKKKFYIRKSNELNKKILTKHEVLKEFCLKTVIGKSTWIRKVGIIKNIGNNKWLVQKYKLPENELKWCRN